MALNTSLYDAAKRAQQITKTAISEGLLPAPTEFCCADCGADAEVYDHRDYTKPLEVDPVCRSCNSKRGSAEGYVPFYRAFDDRGDGTRGWQQRLMETRAKKPENIPQRRSTEAPKGSTGFFSYETDPDVIKCNQELCRLAGQSPAGYSFERAIYLFSSAGIVERLNGRMQTKCKRGHPFSIENTYFWRGQRACRACQKVREQKRRNTNQ